MVKFDFFLSFRLNCLALHVHVSFPRGISTYSGPMTMSFGVTTSSSVMSSSCLTGFFRNGFFCADSSFFSINAASPSELASGAVSASFRASVMTCPGSAGRVFPVSCLPTCLLLRVEDRAGTVQRRDHLGVDSLDRQVLCRVV